MRDRLRPWEKKLLRWELRSRPRQRVPVIVPARVVSWVSPEAPASLVEALCPLGAAGPDFEALFTIRADGAFSVETTQTAGSAALDALALEAARRWTFQPATLDGRPVDSYLRLRVEFRLL